MKFVILCLLSLLPFAHSASASTAKVLYITHEPGKHHKYTPQLEIFKDVSNEAGWGLTVWTGEHHDQVEKLKTPDYGKGFDAIVYNFCFANERDIDACNNLMNQTRKNGVPALLIHCTMHSFWATFKSGKKDGKAHPDGNLVKEWKRSHPGEAFPAWGDFTGVASTTHGPRKPINMIPLKSHPATSRLGVGYVTGNTELYNNHYVRDEVIPLVEGLQKDKNGGFQRAIVMWEHPQGKSKIIGLSIGHGVSDWNHQSFQHLLIDGINYLVSHPNN